MKYLFSFLLVLFLSYSINAQIIEKYDESFFLKSIVDGYYLIEDSSIVWKPTIIEEAIFPKSDDGFCYTELDTLFELNKDSVIAVFSTSEKAEGWTLNCHACLAKISVALFVKNDSIWKLENFTPNFNRYGAFGYRPYILIKYQLDSEIHYFIELDFPNISGVGSPISTSQKQWFDLNGDKVFSFDYEYGDGKRMETSNYILDKENVIVSIFNANNEMKKIKDMKYKFNSEKNVFEIIKH